MTAANATLLALILSILLIVYSFAARTTIDDALFLFRQPMLLARSMLVIYVIVPCFAIALSLIFPLTPYAKFALIALSVSPIAPILPLKQMKVGGEAQYVVGLLVAAAVLALVVTPLLLDLASNLLGADAHIRSRDVARPLIITIALPLAVGMIVNRFAPRLAEATYSWAHKLGTLLLLAGLAVILASQFRTIISLVGDGTLLAIAGTVLVGIAAAHIVGGGSEGDKAALAIAAAMRHPGVAVAIASLNFADQKAVATSAVLLFLITNAIVTLPYVRWMKGRAQVAAAKASPA